MHWGFNFYTAKGAERRLMLSSGVTGTGLGMTSCRATRCGLAVVDATMKCPSIKYPSLYVDFFVCTYSGYRIDQVVSTSATIYRVESYSIEMR